jgi:transcriptional regulator with XRE-family HTH domain
MEQERAMPTKRLTAYALNKKAIQNYLIDRDLTQDDFAKTLGISTSYFNELMNGRKSISLNILSSIAEETAIDVRDLIVEVDE